MSSLQQVLPAQGETTIEAVADAALKAGALPLGVGAPESVAFCADLSARLLSDPRARRYPALQALGFWLRPSSVKNMIQNHLATLPRTTRVPRGIVFQIPPGNVDALFGYMAVLSLLAGNVTLLRLPRGHRPEQKALLDILGEALAAAPLVLRNRIVILRYDHEEHITAALSGLCDARMVWGGDETVSTIRRIPLPPLSVEVSFADRFSSLALPAKAYLNAGEEQKDQIVHAIFNDIYLFDQMACASPRLLHWIGTDEHSAEAAQDFYPRLATFAMDHYGAPQAGESVAKHVAQFMALHDLEVASCTTYAPALTVLSLRSLARFSAFKNITYGYGLLMDVTLPNLATLAHTTEKRDQTLAIWGFSSDEIHALVALSAGRGYDRIVPVGQALSFDPVWDGHNLFDTLTRLIQVSA